MSIDDTCPHTYPVWHLAINEDGWFCDCSIKQAFRPDLDRSHISDKVSGILHDLHHFDFIHVSNGTEGELLTAKIADQCYATNTYDQLSIIAFILEELRPSHLEFWRKEAEAWIKRGGPPEPKPERGLFDEVGG